ncbi:MAG: hypothetical protein AAGF32_10535, partial [Pseudomonadota bacterium]
MPDPHSSTQVNASANAAQGGETLRLGHGNEQGDQETPSRGFGRGLVKELMAMGLDIRRALRAARQGPPGGALTAIGVTPERIGEYLQSRWARFKAGHTLTTAAAALAIGVIVAYAAIGFRLLIAGTQFLWLGTFAEQVVTAASATPWYVIILAPFLGGLIVGQLLQRFVPGRRAHGVADV